MKTLIYISFLLSFCFVKASGQKIVSAEIQVNGLTCSMCSQATEKSLKTLDFIGAVTPDLNKNVFKVRFKTDRPVSVDQIKNKVEDAGFSVGSLTTEIDFDNVTIDASGQARVGNTIYRFVNAKSKTLDGPVKIAVIDKNFVPAAAFKVWSGKIVSDAYKTGTAVIQGKKVRIYHVNIVS